MKKQKLPFVSIIVIAHNEAYHLEKCFKAIENLEYPKNKLEIIFVDSNSTDNSMEIAKKFADKCIAVKSYWSTAGEAFNAGIINSKYNFVHITGGDIILDKKYLLKAITTLQQRDDIVCCTGYFVEKNNIGWNKILGYRRLEEIDTSDHFTPTPNGGTFRKSALYEVNGYDERIKKGQETELGIRLRKEGYKILFRNIPQGIHDFDIKNALEFISKKFINGQSLGHLMLLYFKEKENSYFKSSTKSGIKLLITFSFIIIAFITSLIINKPILLLAIITSYCIYIISSLLIKKRKHPIQYKIYSILMSFTGIFQYLGIIVLFSKYVIFRLKGINIVTSKKGLKGIRS